MKRLGVRLRFTALYSGLFLATSATLLVGMNLVLNENLHRQVAGIPGIAFQTADLTPAIAPPGLSAPPASRRPRHPGSTEDSKAPAGSPPPDMAGSPPPDMYAALEGLPHAVLAWQWIIAGAMIALLTLLSIILGWWLAGRLLRPVRHITETARRLSLSNLHERIALTGPRDEFFELAQTFDTMLERLERSVDNQRRFIANAAHELRTPLAIQRAAIQIGLDCPSPERLAQVREELLEVNRRNERLINGLLLLAQADHGLEATEPVALDTLVREAVSETPTTDGIVIRQNTQPVIVEGDPVLLHRLATNLIHNAVQYNQPNGLVDVRVTAAGVLTVSNTGPEIPEHRINQLFEPFRSLHKARTASSTSAGLGLSIVASIARAHNAAISARPNPGGGLELTVRFHVIQGEGPLLHTKFTA